MWGLDSKPKRTAAAAAPVPARATIVEQAREEREKRAAERAHSTKCVSIQSVVRSWLARVRLSNQLMSSLSGKLSDLSKLENIIKLTKKDTVFRPPAAALWKLLRPLRLVLLWQPIPALTPVRAAHLVSILSGCCKWVELSLHPSCDFSEGPLSPADALVLSRLVRALFDWIAFDGRKVSLKTFLPPATVEDKLAFARLLSTLFAPSSKYNGCLGPTPLIARIRSVSITLLCRSPMAVPGNKRDFLSADALPARVRMAQTLLHIPFATIAAPAPTEAQIVEFVQQILTLPGLGYCTLKFASLYPVDASSPPMHAVVCLPTVWDTLMCTYMRWQTKQRLCAADIYASTASDRNDAAAFWCAGNWLLANTMTLCPPLSYLTTPGLTATVELLAELLPLLPLEVYVHPVPIVTTQLGSQFHVHEMPRVMVLQLAEITTEAFIRKVFRKCFDMRSDKLRNSRLKLPDHEGDPAISAVSGGSGAPKESRGVLSRLWESSKLAAKFFSGSKSGGKPSGSSSALSGSGLVNVTSVSRAIAAGGAGAPSAAVPPLPPVKRGIASKPARDVLIPFDTGAACACARLFACVLMGTHRARGLASVATAHTARRPLLCATVLTDTLSFTPNINAVKVCWYFTADTFNLDEFVREQAFPSRCRPEGPFAVLTVLCRVFEHTLRVLDEFEFYQDQKPMPRREIKAMCTLLKDVIARSCGQSIGFFGDSAAATAAKAPDTEFWEVFQHSAIKLLAALHDKHTARPVTDEATWIVDSSNAGLQERLLQVLPFTVPFPIRAARFTDLRNQIRVSEQELKPSIRVTIQRSRLFESAFENLNRLGVNWQKKLSIVFVNDFGMEEIGIDAGGLFKELWTQLSAIAFNPEYGFFKVTSQGQLYPNPNASVAMPGINEDALFEFLGRVLGKALAEGVVVQPQFARFFLAKLLHKPTHMHDHLPYLDMELYKNLMFLRNFDGNVEDLCLTFSASTDVFGETREVELIPGGSDIPVTSRNRLKYIYLMAALHLDASIKRQCKAFCRGLNELIPNTQLVMFSEPELQVLISGSSAGISVTDLKDNTSYAGGYSSISPSIRRFWAVVETFSANDLASLLKFVTSCERAPPLGFKDLQPSFCIQRAGGDDDRLPTASTCFNILKLPAYSSEKIMRKQLLAAIHSGAGFDLS